MFELVFSADLSLLVRSFLAFCSSFALMMWVTPKLIDYQLRRDISQPIRDFGPEHSAKKGTPSMGGVAIISSIVISTLLWADIGNSFVQALIFAAISFGCIGLFDDLTKINLKNYAGITGKIKFFLQLFFGLIIYLIVENNFETNITTKIVLPFFKSISINLSFLYIFFILFVIVGSSNAVNLTDGLDGLASFPVFICMLCFVIVAFFVGDSALAQKVNMFYVIKSAEIIPLCCAVCAACLGFLWFNSKPASIMMGDVGSLSLGALVATVAFILKQEILLAFFGLVFVIETMSVIMQVLYFKNTGGERLFLMSPIHHHFEKKGWEEGKIVVRFWILSIFGAVIGMCLFFS